MGMFDYYEPNPPLLCPVCRTALMEWQGKDGPCWLFLWRQGYPAPTEQRVDAESGIAIEGMEQERLPDEFLIYSYDCDCPSPVEAVGKTHEGVWASTELVTAENTVQRPHETRGDFKMRVNRLKKIRTDG